MLVIPLCMINGITNIQLSLNVLSPFLAGYMIPGKPIGVMLFKVFSTIVLGQAQVFTGDMKLGKDSVFRTYIERPITDQFSTSALHENTSKNHLHCSNCCLHLVRVRANSYHELGSGQHPWSLLARPEIALYLSKRQYFLLLEHCLGSDRTETYVWTWFDLPFHYVVLAAWSSAAGSLLSLGQEVSEISSAVFERSCYARRHGLATSSYAPQLFLVGFMGLVVQLLD